MTWQRATQPAQKDERRMAILVATRTLLDAPPHDPSLRAIATHAGLSASGVYRYFSSREAVFLAVLAEDIEHWCEQMSAAVRQLPEPSSVDIIVDAMVDATVTQERAIRLLGQRSSLLEKASTAQEIASFRLQVLHAAERAAPELRRLLPSLSEALIRTVQLQTFSLIAATAHLRFPTEAAIEAMRHPELASAAVDFAENLREAVRLTIHGALFQSQRG